MTVYKISIVVAGVALATSGCSYSPTRAALAQMSQPEQAEAIQRSKVRPAGISTVQFKEMGDSARARAAAGLIRRVWQESCDVSMVLPGGYLITGESRWRVRCAGSTNVADYSINLPETASGTAQVLQCQTIGTRSTECSFLGRSKVGG